YGAVHLDAVVVDEGVVLRDDQVGDVPIVDAAAEVALAVGAPDGVEAAAGGVGAAGVAALVAQVGAQDPVLAGPVLHVDAEAVEAVREITVIAGVEHGEEQVLLLEHGL